MVMCERMMKMETGKTWSGFLAECAAGSRVLVGEDFVEGFVASNRIMPREGIRSLKGF